MDQIVFFGFALSLFWLSVISVVVCLTLLRIRRLQQLEYAYLREAYAQAKKTPSSLATSTREHPIVRSQPLTLQSFKHTNPSEHVSLAIEPDESPTRIEVHVKRIIKHLQADKRSIG